MGIISDSFSSKAFLMGVHTKSNICGAGDNILKCVLIMFTMTQTPGEAKERRVYLFTAKQTVG